MSSRDKKLHSLIAEQAAEWHVACSEGDLSAQQTRDFMRWLRTSPVHVAEYLTLAKIANDVSEVARDNLESLQDLLARGKDEPIPLVRKTGAGSVACDWQPSPREYRPTHAPYTVRRHDKPRVRRAGRWAAAAAVLAVAFIAVWVGLRVISSEPTQATFATRHGELRSLTLPDGTRVQLDSDSAIKIRFDRGSRTVVVDRGQAYFKVIKDTGAPFLVRVGSTVIRDIGTAFDVYRHSSGTTIMVAEGRVQVWHVPPRGTNVIHWMAWLSPERRPRGEPVANLGSGEQVSVTHSGAITSQRRVDTAQVLAWTRGRIMFDDATAASIAAQLNRYSNVQISLMGPRIGALRVNGTLASHDADSFIAFLREQPNVRVVTHGQRVLVYEDSQEPRRK